MRAGHIALAALAGFAAGLTALLLGHSFWVSLLIYSATGLCVLGGALIVTLGGGLIIAALSRPPAPARGLVLASRTIDK